MGEFVYQETTENIAVEANPVYIEARSRPELGLFFYAYTIKITNMSSRPCQLVARQWIIRDGQGKEEVVRGEGVVGETPLIQPGEFYQYTSACPLKTPTGNMRGKYYMKDENGKTFEVNIPLFFLRPPYTFQ